jgi:hypothetical protein
MTYYKVRVFIRCAHAGVAFSNPALGLSEFLCVIVCWWMVYDRLIPRQESYATCGKDFVCRS